MARCAFFDVTTGTSGDMIVAALLDAGAPADAVLSAMTAAGSRLDPLHVTVKQSQGGTRVIIEHETRSHCKAADLIRALNDATAMLAIASAFPMKALMALISGECAVHDTVQDALHVHEIGSADTLATIIGTYVAAASLDLFAMPVLATPIATGYGTITIAHGTVAVPAPVTRALLADYETVPGPIEAEVTTPTGAAILTTLISGQTTHTAFAGSVPRRRGRGIGAKRFDPPSSLGFALFDG